VAFGFLSLCQAVVHLFPRHAPGRFPAWIALALVPNFIRNVWLPNPSFWDTWIHHQANVVYLVGCGMLIYWTLRARHDGDPMGRRLFLGFIGVTIPVVVEVVALSVFNTKVRLSGFSLVFLAMAIGTSWQSLMVRAMEARIHKAETELEAWRSLVPGSVFRTDRPSPLMEGLFGSTWPERIKANPDAPLIGTDGMTYRVESRPLHHQERLGWFERDEDTQPGTAGFLSGWTVGLGMDDAAEHARILALLQAWGAEVRSWGTVPPREGPYPSVLLWAREPSILSVWRESDLQRRRSRWIQIGGPITDGPHVRLEPGMPAERLRDTLEHLLSRH